jgi:hypothetical protein
VLIAEIEMGEACKARFNIKAWSMLVQNTVLPLLARCWCLI